MYPPATHYDLVTYPSYTHAQTHPDRLAVIGSLFGLEPAPVDGCRVLELGCGNGTNLVPMAWRFPQSKFIGIDLAARPVARGNEMLRDLGLTNIQLVHGSLTEISRTWGSFDYIIAHGLYSWIPDDVRDHLLTICHDCLASQGIAFVSYNALPGCHLRNMLREMMLFHVRGFDSADERVKQSLAFVRFLADAQDTEDDYRRWLKAESQRILEHDEGHLYHDELSELNEPLYFTQFMERAARHGLQYVGEADYFEMSDHIFKDSVRHTLEQLSANRLLREQYLDFLKCRRFRQTLLCHHEARLRAEPLAEKVAGFLVSCATECTSQAEVTRPGTHFTFESAKGAKIETDFALGQAALIILEAVRPKPLAFEELLEKSEAHLTQTTGREGDRLADRVALCGFLLRLYAAGIVEFRTTLPTMALTPGERPVASPVARWQAARGDFVTSLFHVPVKVEDEIGRNLLTWLDGQHDRGMLLDKLQQLLQSKKPLASPAAENADLQSKLASELENNLAKLARIGLLVA